MEIVCLCRAGFEKETIAEVQWWSGQCGLAGYVRAKDNSGVVVFVSHASEKDVKNFLIQTPFIDLVFIRHWFYAQQIIELPDKQDRVGPILKQALELEACQDLDILLLDTNEGKSLSALSKSIAKHLSRELKRENKIDVDESWRAQLLFVSGDQAYFGQTYTRNVSSWLGGIPRLKAPRAAPSRATLKLEEAWHHFIPKNEWPVRLAPGKKAVDLGAAPGGWTWQLVQKSMFVEAVDNGPMDESLMESGQVHHHREDGFSFTPKKSVYWLVCDIADKPARVAGLIARWASERWCTEAVFNLKLPMKKRYEAVQAAAEQIQSKLENAGINYELRFKQLYHDREEVTGHLRLFLS